jgi:hypothetical protein
MREWTELLHSKGQHVSGHRPPSTLWRNSFLESECFGELNFFRPLTADAKAWLTQHTNGQWFGGRLLVETRYLENLLTAMQKDLG